VQQSAAGCSNNSLERLTEIFPLPSLPLPVRTLQSDSEPRNPIHRSPYYSKTLPASDSNSQICIDRSRKPHEAQPYARAIQTRRSPSIARTLTLPGPYLTYPYPNLPLNLTLPTKVQLSEVNNNNTSQQQLQVYSRCHLGCRRLWRPVLFLKIGVIPRKIFLQTRSQKVKTIKQPNGP
jgi:hypothetical protein